jgi:cytochrome c2
MRLHQLLVLLLPGLPAAAIGEPDPQAAAHDVRLEGAAPAPVPPPTHLLTPVPEPAATVTGRLLLHRRGCTSCHDLELPAYPHVRGPDLDEIGQKTQPGWLELWLRDPVDYLPHSRMPRVLLGDAARTRLVAWLSHLGRTVPVSSPSPLPTLTDADVYRGGRLFDSLQCQGCHAGGGTGGQIGPALDRLGWKLNADWLIAALQDPAEGGLSPQSHPYVLSARDVADLSAYLIRRFTPRGGPEQVVSQITIDPAQGLAEGLLQGCFQCHRVAALRGPRLRLPVSGDRAMSWLDFHETPRGDLPTMPLSTSQRHAMMRALTGDEETVAANDAAPSYWALPIAPQGEAVELFTAGRRLESAACGRCHEQQMEEWRGSSHAAAFSPGLRALLMDASPGFVTECLSCHTPLHEQIEQALSMPQDGTGLGPVGVDCAGCHVRAQRYYGPGTPGNRNRLAARTFEAAHHGGVEAAPELFADKQFCTSCHQFPAGGLALEGKLLQNTYGEWLTSPAAGDGSTCQSCHMPGGDHRMRGLHDRDFVRSAVAFEATWHRQSAGRGRLAVILRNVGAGHAVPTYTTGALHVKVFLSDSHDGVIEASLQTRAAQRRLSADGQTELFDTRIPAGGAWHYEQLFEIDAEARHINILVEVDPDHFYRRFFALLEPPNAGARMLLEQARGRISDSPYILYARQIRITDED